MATLTVSDFFYAIDRRDPKEIMYAGGWVMAWMKREVPSCPRAFRHDIASLNQPFKACAS